MARATVGQGWATASACAAVIVATLAAASVGAFWSWAALPLVIDDSLQDAWARIGPPTPLLMFFAIAALVGALAAMVFAVIMVARGRARGGARVLISAKWSAASAAIAAVAAALPGLVVNRHVVMHAPDVLVRELPAEYVWVDAARSALAPGLAVVALSLMMAELVRASHVETTSQASRTRTSSDASAMANSADPVSPASTR